jgi:hypothetical protein
MAANTVVTMMASGLLQAVDSGKRIATNSVITTAFRARSAAKLSQSTQPMTKPG